MENPSEIAGLIEQLGIVAMLIVWVYAERRDARTERERADKMTDKAFKLSDEKNLLQAQPRNNQ